MKKKLLLAIMLFIGCISLSGCYPKGYVMVNDYGRRIELLKANFPEIYDMFCDGKILIDEMYTYPTDEGGERVHVSYQYIK